MTQTRRSILKAGIAAIAAPAIVPSSVFGQNAPSNRITIGAIGVGRISRIHDMHETFKYDHAQIVAVCDLDSNRVKSGQRFVDEACAKKCGRDYTGTKGYGDYRELSWRAGISTRSSSRHRITSIPFPLSMPCAPARMSTCRSPPR